ncbi:MAG: transcription antitermination factor NusB [Solirubrobacterales bacterium]
MKRSDQRREAVFALYQHEVNQRQLDGLLEGTKPFTRALVEGVGAHRDELDSIIDAHSHEWSIDRIAPLEKAIMRCAVYELRHRDDVPEHVAVSEAVELAASYCGAGAPKFVNGVLAAIAGEAGAAGPEPAGGEQPKAGTPAHPTGARSAASTPSEVEA